MPVPPSYPIEDLSWHTGWVRALARRLVADSHLAEDVAQDTWLAALGSGARGPVWLAGAVRNLAANLRRRTARRARAESHCAPADAAPGAAETAALVELQRILAEAVLALDPPFRDVVLLRFYDGLPRREIARRLQVPVATVNSRLTRALARLRGRLDGVYGGDRRAWITALGSVAWGRAGGWLLGVSIMQSRNLVAAALAVVLIGGAIWVGARYSGVDRRAEPVPSRVVLSPVVAQDAAGREQPAGQRVAVAVAVTDAPPPATPVHGPRVRVVDGLTGEPMPQAELICLDGAMVQSPAARDLLGEHRLRGGNAMTAMFDLARPLPLDADAIATVAVPDASDWRFPLVARCAERQGMLDLRAGAIAAGETAVLELWPVRSVRVRVVDRTGTPLANVPVGLHARRPGSWSPICFVRTRAPDGAAEHSWFRSMDMTGNDIRPGVSLAFPLAQEVVEPVDADAPLDVTLLCPEVGTVDVVVTLGGAPAPDGTLVLLRDVRSEEPWEQTLTRAETKGGRATFWPVGLATELAATVEVPGQRLGTVDVTGAGPRSPGATITLTLATAWRTVRLSGRVVGSDGSPIASTWVLSRNLDRPGDAPGAGIRTDAEGRFDEPFSFVPDATGGCRLEIDGVRGGHGCAEVPVRDPGRGDRADVGDVRLPAVAPLIDGVVVDARGEPLRGVIMRLVRKSGSDPSGWEPYDGHYNVQATGADGRFAIHGVPPAPDFGVRATVRGPLRHEPEGFTPGTRDLRLVMRDAGALLGRLLVARDVPADSLLVKAWPQSRGVPGAQWGGWIRGFVESDGSVHLHGVEPDAYTVAVVLPGLREVARIAGIVVRVGDTTEDRRLSPLDLRTAVRAIELHVRDERGTPLRASVRARITAGAADEVQMRWVGTSDRPLLLLATDDLRALVVSCEGWSPAVVSPVEDHHDLVLHR